MDFWYDTIKGHFVVQYHGCELNPRIIPGVETYARARDMGLIGPSIEQKLTDAQQAIVEKDAVIAELVELLAECRPSVMYGALLARVNEAIEANKKD